MSPRVAVVDDATVVRQSLAGLLDCEDAGRYASVEELLDAAPDADLVLLDLHLANERQAGVRQGVAAIQAAVAAGYRVCAYSQEERRFVLAACLAAGAGGVVSKAAPLEQVRRAVDDVVAGELVAPAPVLGLLQVLAKRRSLTILGPRLQEVLAGRARGLTHAQIGQRLFLSESTVRGYWRDLTSQVSRYLEETTAAEIERALGLAPGDLLEVWPEA